MATSNFKRSSVNVGEVKAAEGGYGSLSVSSVAGLRGDDRAAVRTKAAPS